MLELHTPQTSGAGVAGHPSGVGGPLSSEYGTHETVTARFWPWLTGKSHSTLSGFGLRVWTEFGIEDSDGPSAAISRGDRHSSTGRRGGVTDSNKRKSTRQVDTRLPVKGNSNSPGARPVHQIISGLEGPSAAISRGKRRSSSFIVSAMISSSDFAIQFVCHSWFEFV